MRARDIHVSSLLAPGDQARLNGLLAAAMPVQRTPQGTVACRRPWPPSAYRQVDSTAESQLIRHARYGAEMETARDGATLTAWDVAVFADELLLLAVLAVAGAGLGDALVVRIVLAIVLPLAVVILWGRWLAPRASRRLGNPAGPVVKIVLFAIASALLAATGTVLWAALFGVVSLALLVTVEMSARRKAP